MKIYLEAVGADGGYLEIGRYKSPVLPRIGEKISLQLVAMPPRPQSDQFYPSQIRLRVVDVDHRAYNHLAISEHTLPYPNSMESTDVSIQVQPEDDAARKYFAYLTAREESN